MRIVAPNTTQISHRIGLFDSTGAPLTGKVAATFQTPVLFITEAGTKGTITLSDLASEGAAFSAGGLYEHGAGEYRLDFTTNGVSNLIYISASGTVGSLISESILIASSSSALIGINSLQTNGVTNSTATAMIGVNVVQVGGTNQTARDIGAAVPAANAGASGGLFILGANTGTATLTGAWNIQGLIQPGTGTGQLDLHSGLVNAGTLTTYTGNTPQTGDVFKNTVLRIGTAQAGSAATLTLDAGASTTPNLYLGCIAVITGGTGAGQAQVISGYGTINPRRCEFLQSWATEPDNTSTFAILPMGMVYANTVFYKNTLITDPATAGIPDVNLITYAGGMDPYSQIYGVQTGDTLPSGSMWRDFQQIMAAWDSMGAVPASGDWALASVWTPTIAAHLDANVSSRMATYTQPTGFLAATFPTGTIANTTNITAGTIATVTNLTNAPTAGDFTAAMKTSLNAATPGGGGLSGPSSVTIQWNDSANAAVPLVQFSVNSADNSTLIGSGVASSNGNISFGSQNGTFTIVSNPTSTVLFSNAVLVVSGATSLPIKGMGIVPPSTSNPLQTRCSLVCYTPQAAVDPAASVTVQQMLAGVSGAWSNNLLVCTCDANGNILDPVDKGIGVLLARDVLYRAHRGTETPPTDSGWVEFTPTGNSFALPAMIGYDN